LGLEPQSHWNDCVVSVVSVVWVVDFVLVVVDDGIVVDEVMGVGVVDSMVTISHEAAVHWQMQPTGIVVGHWGLKVVVVNGVDVVVDVDSTVVVVLIGVVVGVGDSVVPVDCVLVVVVINSK